MSTVAAEGSPSDPIPSFDNLLLDCPEEAIVVLSSYQDSHEFLVPKLYIIHSSPILREEILLPPNPRLATQSGVERSTDSDTPNANAYRLVQLRLPVNGTILISLLSYILPVPPILPSTAEQIMELLSVAQLYKMDVVLTHLRNHIAQRQPPLIWKETAFSIYALAQKYGLRTEALQAARCTLSFSSLSFQDLAEEDKLRLMPGAFLHELWKYHRRFWSILSSEIYDFKASRVAELGIAKDSNCESLTDSGIPYWLDGYLSRLGGARIHNFLDYTTFHSEYVDHSEGRYSKMHDHGCLYCSEVSEEALQEFWEALRAVVQRSMAKAESDFVLGIEGTRPENDVQAKEARVPPRYSDMPNADIILQSSDLVNFRVHQSVLVTSSLFFGDMFSLPQPLNGITSDGLSVVSVPEDAEVLNSLISMLYPVLSEMPHSSDNILALLAAAEKYDMLAVQNFIRAEASRSEQLSPTDSGGVYKMYAIAYNKRLAPEMERAARLTLDHPLTFKSIGEALRLFDGWALRGLADFRHRCLRELALRMRSFLDGKNGPSKIWNGCPSVGSRAFLPPWLVELSFECHPPGGHRFSNAIPTYVQVFDEFMKALRKHVDEMDCHFCSKVYTLEGIKYCKEMEEVLEQARNVPTPALGDVQGV